MLLITPHDRIIPREDGVIDFHASKMCMMNKYVFNKYEYDILFFTCVYYNLFYFYICSFSLLSLSHHPPLVLSLLVSTPSITLPSPNALPPQLIFHRSPNFSSSFIKGTRDTSTAITMAVCGRLGVRHWVQTERGHRGIPPSKIRENRPHERRLSKTFTGATAVEIERVRKSCETSRRKICRVSFGHRYRDLFYTGR